MQPDEPVTISCNDATPEQAVTSSNKRSLEYTTENFKIEVSNLPKHTKFHIINNILRSHYKLEPHKIKCGERRAYVTFKSEQERDDAIVKINGQQWKGRELSATIAAPRDESFYKKIRNERDDNDQGAENEVNYTDDDINNKVAPLWNLPYEEQLEFKDKAMRKVLNMKKEILKFCPNLSRTSPTLFDWIQANKETCCKFGGVVPSPLLVGYRNKCEFNVGSDGVIGFKMGRFRNGSDRVMKPPRNCPLISELMFKIVDKFQEFLLDETRTKLKGFCRVSHEGHVRQLTIRINEKAESMIIVDIHPQDLPKEELDTEIEKICSLFKEIQGTVSIYMNLSDKENFVEPDKTLNLVFGQKHLHEYLSIIDGADPLKFCIGPSSFFQVNTKGAELLYKAIIEFAGLDSNSLVLDMGCGTGTISLSLTKKVDYVIGVEVVKSAIEDAEINAKENNIENVSFFAGRAEDLITEAILILKSKRSEQDIKGEIIAIVDPPRTGFNNSFVKALRASDIKKIIYVACDPVANSNLVSLCRPESKAYQGDPFVPTRAKAFDLFPQTKFCELLLVYERLNCLKNE